MSQVAPAQGLVRFQGNNGLVMQACFFASALDDSFMIALH